MDVILRLTRKFVVNEIGIALICLIYFTSAIPNQICVQIFHAIDKVSHPDPEPLDLLLNHYQCTRKFKLVYDIVLLIELQTCSQYGRPQSH